MNLNQAVRSLVLAALALLAAAAVPAPSWARHKIRLNVEDRNLRPGGMAVPKGEALHNDLVATGAVVVDGVVDGDCVSLGSSVTVNGEVRGDVVALGGLAVVAGNVTGDLAVLGGPTRISGTVRGDVAALGGDVTLESRSVVDGDVALLGGKLIKAKGAVVRGSVANVDLSLAKYFLPLAAKLHHAPELAEKLSPWRLAAQYVIFLVFLAGLGLMALLLTVFLPKNVESAAAAIEADFWKAAGIGALILMLTLPALILMVVSVLGIPLIPVAILIYCAAVLMALAAFSLVLAGRFNEARRKPAAATVAAVGQGYLLLVFLIALGKLIKLAGGAGAVLGGIFFLAGLILLSCGLVVGLGALWLTRMGGVGRRTAAQPPSPNQP